MVVSPSEYKWLKDNNLIFEKPPTEKEIKRKLKTIEILKESLKWKDQDRLLKTILCTTK